MQSVLTIGRLTGAMLDHQPVAFIRFIDIRIASTQKRGELVGGLEKPNNRAGILTRTSIYTTFKKLNIVHLLARRADFKIDLREKRWGYGLEIRRQ